MERAMSMMSLSGTAILSRRLPHWSKLQQLFIEWHQRACSRRQLMGLDDLELWDIGLTRTEADQEANKAFWQQ
jgi:uncharacterized protein YjiS (DUF1127 family)